VLPGTCGGSDGTQWFVSFARMPGGFHSACSFQFQWPSQLSLKKRFLWDEGGLVGLDGSVRSLEMRSRGKSPFVLVFKGGGSVLALCMMVRRIKVSDMRNLIVAVWRV
jgi:hypothetical protein